MVTDSRLQLLEEEGVGNGERCHGPPCLSWLTVVVVVCAEDSKDEGGGGGITTYTYERGLFIERHVRSSDISTFTTLSKLSNCTFPRHHRDQE